MKFKPGDMLPPTVMEAVTGEAINLPMQSALSIYNSGASLIARFATRISLNSGSARERSKLPASRSDRVSFLAEINPLVPEGCPFPDGR